jgi:hypothetical protein
MTPPVQSVRSQARQRSASVSSPSQPYGSRNRSPARRRRRRARHSPRSGGGSRPAGSRAVGPRWAIAHAPLARRSGGERRSHSVPARSTIVPDEPASGPNAPPVHHVHAGVDHVVERRLEAGEAAHREVEERRHRPVPPHVHGGGEPEGAGPQVARASSTPARKMLPSASQFTFGFQPCAAAKSAEETSIGRPDADPIHQHLERVAAEDQLLPARPRSRRRGGGAGVPSHTPPPFLRPRRSMPIR